MLRSARMQVRGMESAQAIRQVSDTLVGVPGVADVGVNGEAGLVEVRFDLEKTTAEQLKDVVRRAGFHVE
jgi:copper chaperone CopZ